MTAPVRDRATLLASAKPILRAGEFGFCSIPHGQTIPAGLTPLLHFVEDEGTTLIVPIGEAQASGMECQFQARMITLNVNSALDAVGFLAAIATRLAAVGISINAVSAFHHDHIFVPTNRAAEAMQLLSTLA